ncbi:MAG: heavy metal-associated domain-containing protein [Pseudomonadota bacterium]
MKKTTITVVAALGLAGVGIGATILFQQSSTEVAVQSPADLQAASFAVENMTCATCPITVRRAMRGVDGVHDVTINFEAKTATARFDPDRTTTNAIAAASTEAGYPAQRIAAERL